jgi:beta-glucosidase
MKDVTSPGTRRRPGSRSAARKSRRVAVVSATVAMLLVGAAATASGWPAGARASVSQAPLLPYKNPKLSVAQRVSDLLGRMTLGEKAGQMTQVAYASSKATRPTTGIADR